MPNWLLLRWEKGELGGGIMNCALSLELQYYSYKSTQVTDKTVFLSRYL